MRRVTVALVLVACLALAGCTGDGGTNGDADGGSDLVADATSTATASATATPTPTPTATPLDPDGHPFVEGNSLNTTALVGQHLTIVSTADSFTVTNNGTNRYVGNGSLAARLTVVRQFDIADSRWYLLERATAPNGSLVGRTERFVTGSRICTRFTEDVQCEQGQATRQQAIGMTVERTVLETVAGPAFEPDGTVQRAGQQFYRYTATSLRSELPDSAASELGENPSLQSATLLVTPEGRIAEYRITYERDAGGDTRGEIQRVYRTLGIDSTEVQRPDWVPSEG